jgi:hypothetical protein
MSSTLEQIQQASEKSEKALTLVNSMLRSLEMTAQRALAVEQTSVAHGKLLLSIVRVALKKGLFNDSEIERESVLIREEEDKDRIKKLLEAGAIEARDFVSDGSILAVSQRYIQKDGGVSELTSYRLLSSEGQELSEELKKELQNKKAGDNVNSGEDQGGQYVLSILEIYNLKEITGQGEAQLNSEGQEVEQK